MDKFSFISLWDAYGGLLTSVQREITDLYFNKDLTVSEIAEEKGISRQAVSECLKACKKQLEDCENKLRLLEKLRVISIEWSLMLTDACGWVEKFKAAHPELAGEAEALNGILLKDYSEEAAKALSESGVKPLDGAEYKMKVFGASKTGDE